MRISYIIITSVLLCTSFFCKAQDEEEKKWSPKKEIRKNRPYYIGIGFGRSKSAFRDFATSPLIYEGNVLSFDLSLNRVDAKKETSAMIRLSTGNYFASIAENTSLSSGTAVFSSYQQLFKLEKYSNDKWNTKLGGNLSIVSITRSNPGLQNNSFGQEIIGTLSGSVKVTRDISRKNSKKVKLWFIKYKLKPLRRDVSIQFNAGLLNSNLRNGFAFIGQSPLLNDSRSFDDYQLSFLSGFRLSSQIDYTLYLTKGNLVKFSYLWDAYRTGEEFEKFEMGNHVLSVSLWFRTK